jgi:N,N-dimethylformamidase
MASVNLPVRRLRDQITVVNDPSYVVGYADPWSVRAGSHVSVMLSSDAPVSAQVSVVRLGPGDPSGAVDEDVVLELGSVDVTPQATRSGSCVLVGSEPAWPAGPFVAAVYCQPTRLGRPQTLLAQAGGKGRWWLGVDAEGRPSAEVAGPAQTGPVVATVEAPLVEGAWYLVAAAFDEHEGVEVFSLPLKAGPSWRIEATTAEQAGRAGVRVALPIGGLLEGVLGIAAAPVGDSGWQDCFDGKLEAPTLLRGGLDEDTERQLVEAVGLGDRVLARWELGPAPGWHHDADPSDRAVGSTSVPSRGTHRRLGQACNSPLGGVTGHNWTGREVDFRLAPDEYRAMHFHSDDLDDCGWNAAVAIEIPQSMQSGIYALRVDADERPVERVPFFVRPTHPSAPLLFLVPTASYLAYANDHPVSDGDFSEATAGRIPLLYDDDLLMHAHREWGLSMYDCHLDGSGVAISSWRRPLMNMRATHRYHVGPWQFPADLYLAHWLSQAGYDHDVATDGDLHAEADALLTPYRVVVTGTHPEYYSSAMLDALEAWTRGGGRLVCVGANGFYWRVAFDPERPWVMELRRGQAGSRAWESAPGENHLAFSSEPGGLWRHLGRPPQKLTGVGYAGQGFDASGWYRKLAASGDARAAWVFDGVEGETFGTSGSIGGGAVGQELDRADSALGTPADALVLATSEGLSGAYQRCVEEVPFTLPGLSALVDPDVRADVVYHVKPSGGAVFATGSIAWSGALGIDPGVDRITRNVLDRFLDPTPLPW